MTRYLLHLKFWIRCNEISIQHFTFKCKVLDNACRILDLLNYTVHSKSSGTDFFWRYECLLCVE